MSTPVLVVEDDALIREFLGEFLPQAGYPCTTAPTAEAALELLSRRAFAFVLADIRLPDMNGLELTRRIKKGHPGTAVIAMTGYSEQYVYDTVLEAGADDFLKKPFTAAEVLARIRVVQLRQDLHHWAVTDELTGVYNRKGFFTLGQHLLKVARRSGDELFLLYADLDNLKSINDTHGHQTGDLALHDVAGIMRENFRESDIVARIGGDEFVVFPVGTTVLRQELLVRRFEGALEIHNAAMQRPFQLSMSYGVSSVRADRPVSLDELLLEADRAMYARKSAKKSALPAVAASQDAARSRS